MGTYQDCSTEPELTENIAQDMFSTITSKWAVRTLLVLRERELRFSQLKKHLHTVTDRMLIKTLHELEAEGFICRNVSETGCKKVFYSLSSKGRELAALLQPLTAWLRDYALSVLNTTGK